MQKVSEDCGMDDDMVDGDLGFGMGVRAAASPTRRKAHSFVGVADAAVSRAERFRRKSQTSESPWFPGPKAPETQGRAQWRLSQSGRRNCRNTGIHDSTHTHTHTPVLMGECVTVAAPQGGLIRDSRSGPPPRVL